MQLHITDVVKHAFYKTSFYSAMFCNPSVECVGVCVCDGGGGVRVCVTGVIVGDGG